MPAIFFQRNSRCIGSRAVSYNQSDALRRSGGIAVLVNGQIHSRRLVLEKDKECEFVAVEIKINSFNHLCRLCESSIVMLL